jgi:hypothetical protein
MHSQIVLRFLNMPNWKTCKKSEVKQTMRQRTKLMLLLGGLLALLSACSGGGGGTAPPPTSTACVLDTNCKLDTAKLN